MSAMGLLRWLGENWFTALQSAGIIGGIFFTGVALRIDAQVRRVGNLITLTQQHREIWKHLFELPELSRVLDAEPNLERKPVTSQEELFVRLVILHASSAHHARKHAMYLSPDGMQMDIGLFFALPIPRIVWDKSKALQDEEFVRFVEYCQSEVEPEK